ncbi:hypothetical protein [Acinetobacter tianfuensis]|uniref:Uncharacterized protein n=1 Tax=Acinetobacter tianfuensis TaxID=2419603 RepID=A0A3A8EDX8_9GAMM|nr:hypothetical protein [Acinetobacter tianfuensis]RKG29060.1 hypothetical protein D7V32_16725 [Acinetobacter tianfuensis]
MVVGDCSVITVIEGVNYCLVVIREQSWLDEINKMSFAQLSALLSFAALVWYVASSIRTMLHVLGADNSKE